MVIKVGSPMFEVLEEYSQRINQSQILENLKLEPFKYFVVSAHREENIAPESQFLKLINILTVVAKEQ